jgi:hypothetical protein
MNPTPEQVAAWAKAAGISPYYHGGYLAEHQPVSLESLQNLVVIAFTEGRVYQAEQDAKVCEKEAGPEVDFPDEIDNSWAAASFECAAAIRANAPKGSM